MQAAQLYKKTSVIHALDPRLRVIGALFFSVQTAVLAHLHSAVLAFLIGAGSVVLARLPGNIVRARIKRLNLFMLALIAVLSVTVNETGIAFTAAGYLRGVLIAVKSNAIVLFLTATIATIELTILGHALHHLRVPRKLIHIFLFTVRYLDVLHQEYERLVNAMRVRGFMPAVNMHTYKSYANLVGMLLVRGIDRSERIVKAMKCRGFRGKFFIRNHFVFHPRDVFAAAAMAGIFLFIFGADRI